MFKRLSIPYRKLLPFLTGTLLLLNTGDAQVQPGPRYPSPATLATGVDICIYGGTSAGVIAAYSAARLHKKVLLVEPGYRLGGLSSGGLGFTDIGNKYVVTGLARDFYRRVGQHYGRFEQWIFEPKVADSLFSDYIRRAGVTVAFGKRLRAVRREGNRIGSITLEAASTGKAVAGAVIKAKEFIDCSYEGDLMAKAGVSYTTGREDNSTYHETVDGVQMKDKHQFPDGIDPYKVPGRPESGLLWGISNGTLAAAGTGDKKIQAYNFRICLTNDPANRIDITRPDNYDSTHYALLLRYLAASPAKDLGAFLKIDRLPGNKTDINNNGPFSTDMMGMNYDYPDGDYATREQIIRDHEDYTRGFLYFIGHDPGMPEHLRRQMLQWGYPKDEFLQTGHWTPQLYVREARRMTGAYIMTQDNCQGKVVVADGVGQGAYNMDSHNAERIVVNGMVKNEGDVQLRGINPYPIAYRSITPKRDQCSNLLVPVCLSATHMAYGSIRMEPVFMVLGQASAYAACQAIDRRAAVQEIDTRRLQGMLKDNPLADGSSPEILVDNDDVTGISLKGGWTRRTVGGYGPSFLEDSASSGAEIRFVPVIRQEGNYAVYYYYPIVAHAASVLNVELSDGKKIIKKNITRSEVKVIGQTSGEWVSLGTLRLQPGHKAFIRVSDEGADGAIVADAVLLVPVRGDLPGRAFTSMKAGTTSAGAEAGEHGPQPNAARSKDPKVINAGVGGNNTTDLLNRVDKDCLSHSPTLTILMAGTNDMNSQKYVPLDQYRQNIIRLITKIKGSGSELLLITILPPYEPYLLTRHPASFYQPEGVEGRRRQVNEVLRQVALQYKVPLLDLGQRFEAVGKIGTDKGSLIQNEANSNKADGVHPTPDGYRFIALAVYDYITDHLLPADNIVCFGDSITYGDGTTDKESYPAYLGILLNSLIY